MGILDWFRAPTPPLPTEAWVLVPLGNPGEAYAQTRHNLARLLLARWQEARERPPALLRRFPSGSLHALSPRLALLVPGTYMNLSGVACAEAVAAGLGTDRLVLLHDDKDLPLGRGRFRTGGGDGGHNGLKSVLEHLGSSEIARLRLGIGPARRPLHDFVLGEWSDGEREVLPRLDLPFAQFLEELAACAHLETLPPKVNAEAYWTVPGPAVTVPPGPGARSCCGPPPDPPG